MTYVPSTQSDAKNSVRVASASAITIASPGASIDGVVMVSGDRVLLKNQNGAIPDVANGIYEWVASLVPMVRTRDANEDTELTAGTELYAEEGTAGGGKTFVLITIGTIIVGTTAIEFRELGSNSSEAKKWGFVIS